MRDLRQRPLPHRPCPPCPPMHLDQFLQNPYRRCRHYRPDYLVQLRSFRIDLRLLRFLDLLQYLDHLHLLPLILREVQGPPKYL